MAYLILVLSFLIWIAYFFSYRLNQVHFFKNRKNLVNYGGLVLFLLNLSLLLLFVSMFIQAFFLITVMGYFVYDYISSELKPMNGLGIKYGKRLIEFKDIEILTMGAGSWAEIGGYFITFKLKSGSKFSLHYNYNNNEIFFEISKNVDTKVIKDPPQNRNFLAFMIFNLIFALQSFGLFYLTFFKGTE